MRMCLHDFSLDSPLATNISKSINEMSNLGKTKIQDMIVKIKG